MIQVDTKYVLRSANLMRHALSLIAAALIISAFVLIGWLVMDPIETGLFLADGIGFSGSPLHGWQGVALVAVALVQIGLWAAVVWFGQQIFTALNALDVEQASIAARYTARLLWVALIWNIAKHMLGSVIATWNFPDGQRALAVEFGSAEVTTILAALLATFTSHAFVLGAALWQDHRAVI